MKTGDRGREGKEEETPGEYTKQTGYERSWGREGETELPWKTNSPDEEEKSGEKTGERRRKEGCGEERCRGEEMKYARRKNEGRRGKRRKEEMKEGNRRGKMGRKRWVYGGKRGILV